MEGLKEIVVFGEWNKSYTTFGFIICPKSHLKAELKRCKSPILSPRKCRELLEKENRCRKFSNCKECIRDYYCVK